MSAIISCFTELAKKYVEKYKHIIILSLFTFFFQFSLGYYYISNYVYKKIKKKNEKTQNNGLFISPKRKDANLEIGLKSFIMS